MLQTFIERIKKDSEFRIKIFLILSLSFNLLYSAFLHVISYVFYSKWFFVMAIYYGLLSFIRIFMLFQINTKTNNRDKILIMRATGYYLLLLNLVISTMIFLLIFTQPTIKYNDIIVISIATYTFFSLTIAIVNIIKYLKSANTLYISIRVVSLISASVSIVTLTNTMLSTFGSENIILRSIILPILSAVISIFIVICAIIMIIYANRQLKVLKNE